MKILELRLIAFGAFTNTSLDLSRGSEGLHIILGRNEAGKSTILRALNALFFGFPGQTKDNFLHKYSKLSVGGVIHSGDTSLEIMRWKRRNDSLTNFAGQSISEDRLHRMIGMRPGEKSSPFANLFWIDHEQLEEGGRAIVDNDGKGEIPAGEAIFSAASGLKDLLTKQKEIKKSHELLFSKGVRTTGKAKINDLIMDIDKCNTVASDQTWDARSWTTANRKSEELASAITALRATIESQQRERDLLRRAKAARSSLLTFDECQKTLTELGIPVILDENFEVRFRTERDRELREKLVCQRLRQEIDDLENQIQELVVPEAWLTVWDRLDEIRNDLNGERKRAENEPRQHEKLAITAKMASDQITNELIDSYRVPELLEKTTQDLTREKNKLDDKLELARTDLDSVEMEQQAAKSEIEALGPVKHFDQLQIATQYARRIDSNNERDEKSNLLRAERERLYEQLARLPFWRGELGDFLSLVTPLTETIQRYDSRFTEVLKPLANFNEDLGRFEQDGKRLSRKIEELRMSGDFPTEEILATAREVRDGLWSQMRSFCDDPLRVLEKPIDVLCEELTDAISLSDAIADRRFTEVDRVVMMRETENELEIVDREIEEYSGKIDQQFVVKSELENDWRGEWIASGMIPGTPREMLEWLRERQAILVNESQVRLKAEELQHLDRRIEESRSELIRHLRRLDCEPLDEAVGFFQLIALASEAVERLKQIESDRKALQKRERDSKIAIEQKTQDVEVLENTLRLWSKSWSEAMAKLELATSSNDHDAEDEIARRKRIVSQWETLKTTIEERVQFRAVIAEIVERLSFDTTNFADPIAIAEKLLREADKVRARLVAIQTHQKEIEKKGKSLTDSSNMRDQAIVELEVLRQTAQAETLDEVESVVQQSQAFVAAKKRFDEVHEVIRQLAGGLPEAEIRAILEQDDGDIQSRISTLDEEIARHEDERGHLHEDLGKLREELRSKGDAVRPIVKYQEAKCLEAELPGLVERYITLRFADQILDDTIRSYREKHQDKRLKTASELFSRLTLRSFDRLELDPKIPHKPSIVGIRSENEVEHTGMSDGTANQLYLALRLASLLAHLDQNPEPLPLVLDDVLVHFDDDRTSAALEILGEISMKTQVLLFTHHARVGELAKQRLPASQLFIHDLDATIGRKATFSI